VTGGVTKLQESVRDVNNVVENGSDNRRQVDSRGHGTNITKEEDTDQCGTIIRTQQIASRERPIVVLNTEVVRGTAKLSRRCYSRDETYGETLWQTKRLEDNGGSSGEPGSCHYFALASLLPCR